jgi:hypothetical protein
MAETARKVEIALELPEDLARLRLPKSVDRRLQSLLDKQDRGEPLSPEERNEAEGLSELVDLLSLLRLRAARLGPDTSR